MVIAYREKGVKRFMNIIVTLITHLTDEGALHWIRRHVAAYRNALNQATRGSLP